MVEQNGKYFVRIDKSTVAVHRAHSIRVAVGCKSSIVPGFNHGVAQFGDVRLNRLRVEAGEKGVARPMDLPKANTGIMKNSGQAALPRAEHGIDYKPTAGGTDFIQVNQTRQSREVRAEQVRLLNARRLAPNGAAVKLGR